MTAVGGSYEHQDATYQYLAERDAERFYTRLKAHASKTGTHAALMEILPKTEYVAELRLWCLAARAEREIAAETRCN